MDNFSENLLFPKDRNEIIKYNMDLFRLPASVQPILENLLAGRISPGMLVCCNGGCEVCQSVIADCYSQIQRQLNESDQSIQ